MRRRQFRENRCGHRENAKLGFGAKYRHYATKCLPTEKPQELNATVVVMVRLSKPKIRKLAFSQPPDKTRQQLPIHALQAVRKPVSTRQFSEGVRDTVKTSVAYWAWGMSQFSIVMRLIAIYPKYHLIIEPTLNRIFYQNFGPMQTAHALPATEPTRLPRWPKCALTSALSAICSW